jgi:LPS-assembly protein
VKSIYKTLSLLSIFILPAWAMAQAPELSADEPIAYTADSGILIATGNAVYTDEATRVEADEIRYDRNKDRIEASGNVRVTREGLRLLTGHMTYDAKTKSVASGPFRAGYPPLYIEGEAFSGTLDEIDFSKVTIYFREPSPGSPTLKVESGKWIADESVSGQGIRLNALGGLAIPLPKFEYVFGAPTADVDVRLGYEKNLGAYGRFKVLYPFSRQWSAGGNLDFFTNRGVLVGPAFDWRRADGAIRVFADTGWIHDHDSDVRGSDFLGNRISQDRGFIDFGIQSQDEDGGLQFQARGTYLSDSEMLRDFRREEYFQNYQPDSFADFTLQEGDFLLNVFARRQINDYYGMIERLPEVRAEWLPHTLGETQFLIQANASAVRYRSLDVLPPNFSVLFPRNPLGLPGPDLSGGGLIPELVESPYHNRLDGSVTVTRPVPLPGGANLVLRAGGRWTSYQRDATDELPKLSEDRAVGELGFDLSKTLARTFSVDRPQWNMERLRHVTRFSVQYRWHPGAGDELDGIPPYDRFAYNARRPVLDLADLSHVDGLREWSVARIGWENLFMVAGEDSAFRDLLAFNIYQDLLFSATEGEDDWDALYTEANFTPFPWLSLKWRQKFLTEEVEAEANYLSATLSSSDLWTLTFQAEYLRGGIEQYELAGRYRLTENLGLLGYWHYDARLSTLTRQQYGFTRRFGNAWQLEMYVAFNEENAREDDFSVGMRLVWLSF